MIKPKQIYDFDRVKFLEFVKEKVGNESAVEVGVWRGEYTQCIQNINYFKKITGVDPYELYEGYTDRPGKEFKAQTSLEELYNKVSRRFSKQNIDLLRMKSVQASNQFENDSIDFVYLDGNHQFDAVTEDINAWWPKTKGILAGDDYAPDNGITDEKFGVIEAVQNFVKQNDLEFYLTNDRLPTWFVFKK